MAVERRYIVAAAFLAVVSSVGEAATAATSRDRERILEAVAVRELKSKPGVTCVILLPEGWIDHTHDGGMGSPTLGLSPWLLERLRRHRPNLQTLDGPCRDPVLWLGPLRFDDDAGKTANVFVGEVGPHGRSSYSVRKGRFGRWRAKFNCCLH